MAISMGAYRIGFGRNYSEGLLYQLNSDGQSYTVAGIGVCIASTIVVPATYNGLPVTSIGDSAFEACENIKKIVLRNGILAIGTRAFYGCKALESITIPESVTSIGASAFYNCFGLQSLVIPSSITSIGESAFYSCKALESVSIPGSVAVIEEGTFAECENIVDIVIENGVTSIGANAFYNCKSLDNVTIPESVTNISNDAFKTGAYILAVYITNIASWCNITFGNLEANPLASHNKTDLYINGEGVINELIIPNGVTKINDYALAREGGNIIESIILPETLTTIGNYAFYGTWLQSITIPNSVTSIGDHAFENGWLEFVTLGSNLTHIGSYAFKNTYISGVDIPASVTYIGAYAFEGCTNLTRVTLELKEDWAWKAYSDAEGTTGANRLNNTSLSDSSTAATYLKSTYVSKYWIFAEAPPAVLAFTSNGDGTCYVSGIGTYEDPDVDIPEYSPDGDLVTSIGASAFTGNAEIASVNIPDSVTSIGSSAFSGCSALTSIIIPDSVITISSSAFRDCGLTSVTIPVSVTSISSYVFRGCSSLTSITIPNSIISIGSYAFYDCTSLASITIPDGVTTVGSYAFSGCSNFTSITIPNSVTSIGSSAFSGCSNLTSMTLPFVGGLPQYSYESADGVFGYIFGTSSYTGGVSTTQGYALSGGATTAKTYYIPSSLKSVTIAGGRLRRGAFDSCSNLTSITLGNSVTYIGPYAFDSCTKLTSITIPNSVTSIDEKAFYYCTGLTSVTIPNSVTSIASGAFYNCTALEELYFNAPALPDLSSNNSVFYKAGQSGNGIRLVIGSSVTKIPAYQFRPSDSSSTYAPKIVSVEFEEGSICTSIGNYAFSYCNNLTSITIPNSVTAIGYYAFGSTGLTSAVFQTKTDWTWFVYTDSSATSGQTQLSSSSLSNSSTAATYLKSTYSSKYWRYKEVSEEDLKGSDFANAYVISVGQSLPAVIDTAGEYVYFKFTAPSAGTYTFQSTGSYDTYGYLYNSSQSQLTYNDDAGDGSNFLISRTMTSGEIVYIGARMYSSSNTGTFNVSVTKSTTTTITEDGKSFSTAYTLTSGGSKAVTFSAGQNIYFKFTAPSAKSYTFKSTGSTDTYGYLYNSSQTQVASNDDDSSVSSSNRNFGITYSLSTNQTVYLKVKLYSSSATGSSTIMVS